MALLFLWRSNHLLAKIAGRYFVLRVLLRVLLRAATVETLR